MEPLEVFGAASAETAIQGRLLPLCCCTGVKWAGAWPVVLAMVAGEVRLFSVMEVGIGAGMGAAAGVTGAICFLLPRASLGFFLHSLSFSFFQKSDAALKVLKTYLCFR